MFVAGNVGMNPWYPLKLSKLNTLNPWKITDRAWVPPNRNARSICMSTFRYAQAFGMMKLNWSGRPAFRCNRRSLTPPPSDWSLMV